MKSEAVRPVSGRGRGLGLRSRARGGGAADGGMGECERDGAREARMEMRTGGGGRIGVSSGESGWLAAVLSTF